MSPFNLFSIVLLGVIVLGQLPWSNHYRQELSIEIVFFAAFVVSFNFVFSQLFWKRPAWNSEFNIVHKQPSKSLKLQFWIIIIIFTINFLFVGTFEIFELRLGRPYKDLPSFPGVDTVLHPLIIFFAISAFDRGNYFKPLALGTIVSILMVSRVLFFIIFFLFIAKKYKRVTLKAAPLVFAFLVLFGAIGDFRSKNSYEASLAAEMRTSTTAQIAQPTDSFYSTGLPEEIIWAWIYLISPIKNLQAAIDSNYPSTDYDAIFRFIFPNFVSDRMGLEKDKSFLVVDLFNVSTAYGELAVDFSFFAVIIAHASTTVFAYFIFILAIKVNSSSLFTFVTLFYCLNLFGLLFQTELFVFTIAFAFIFHNIPCLTRVSTHS